MEKNNQTMALLFGNNADISLDERARVLNELNKIGSLNFTITKNTEGWFAQCNEVSGIITGNSNPNPGPTEIESQIRDAIFSAFNVKLGENKGSPYFTYEEVNTQEPASSIFTETKSI